MKAMAIGLVGIMVIIFGASVGIWAVLPKITLYIIYMLTCGFFFFGSIQCIIKEFFNKES